MFFLVVLLLECRFPAGTAEDPSVIAPTDIAEPPVAFWYDATAFHAGEKAYAWKDLGVEPKEGARFNINLGQTHEHEPLILNGTLRADAPKLRIGGFGQLGTHITNEAQVIVSKPQSILTDISADGGTPDYLLQMRTLTAKKAGEKLSFSFELTGQMPQSGTFRYRVRDNNGEYYYINRAGFHAPGTTFSLQHIWTERAQQHLMIRFAGWTKEDAACTLRVRARDYVSDTVESWSTQVPVGAVWGERTQAVDVKTLGPGFHTLHFDFLDASGRVVHTDTKPYLKPGEKMPWEGTTYGLEDTVPPPWTKPSFGADGTFGCWNRTVRLGGAGLVSRVTSGGAEVLSAPTTLVADGRALTFDTALAGARTSEGTYILKAREADVTVRATCAFDGFILFEADYPTTLTSLVWRVAASRKEVNGFDDCSTELNDRALFRPGTNPGWTFDASNVQMWWLPGKNGLMGGVVNAHGWHVKDLAHSGRVSSDATTLHVATTFVDTPNRAAKEARRKIRFYLEPTPVKPRSTVLTGVDQSHIENWTSFVCRYFETQYPGFAQPERFEAFRKRAAAGDRIFFYHAANGVSPMSPFWHWYQKDWSAAERMGYYVQEAPLYDKSQWDRCNWTYGCLNNRSFFDFKVWTAHYDLMEACPEMKDFYFDLANPHNCRNPHHACTWKDDFGRAMFDYMLLPYRELYLRVYRMVKAKNPDGLMYGHISRKRAPSDVFFDVIVAGEQYAIGVHQNEKHPYSYADVFTPERMQSFWVPRAQEFVFYCVTQLYRARQCFAPGLLKNHDWKTPENKLATRHMLAYIKIHDLFLYNQRVPHGEGPWPYQLESRVRALGADRTHAAYYKDDGSVTLSKPGPRQLWALYASAKGKMLILLNDTDETVDQVVTVKGVTAKGRDVLNGTPYDFTPGAGKIRLGPRGAAFISFDR